MTKYISVREQDWVDATTQPTQPDAYLARTTEIGQIQDALKSGYRFLTALPFTGHVLLVKEEP